MFATQALIEQPSEGGVAVWAPGEGPTPPRCVSCQRPMTESPFAVMQGKGLDRLVDEMWSPAMQRLGLEYRGDGHSWVEPGDTLFRRLVSFAQLKGAGAVASFGLSLGFAPTIGRNELVYHRTAKSAQFDVFEFYPPTYGARRPVSGVFPELSLYNEVVARRTLSDCAGPLAAAAGAWFSAVRDLATLEAYLRRRVRDNLYPHFHPRPEYPLAFVLAAQGKNREARALLRTAPKGVLELREEFVEKAFARAKAALGSRPL